MRKPLTAMFILLFFCGAMLYADVYIKQKAHTDAFSMMGQEMPDKDEFNHMWVGDNRMAVLGAEQSIILNLDDNLMYMIMHQDKSYVEMTLPLDLSQYFPPQVQQMMGNVTVTVNPTDEEAKIGAWDCKRFDVTIDIMMMTIKQKVWASTDVGFDWKDYSERMLPQVTQAMFRLSGDSIKEFEKIEGFQIKTEITMDMMGAEMRSWTEVVEILKKTALSDTYSVPEGYTKKDKFTLMDIQRR